MRQTYGPTRGPRNLTAKSIRTIRVFQFRGIMQSYRVDKLSNLYSLTSTATLVCFFNLPGTEDHADLTAVGKVYGIQP